MLDPDRPIYRRTPLKLVTFELRFPPIPDLDSTNPSRGVVDALRARYPILGPPPVAQLEFGPAATQHRTRGARFVDRSRTWTVAVMSDAVAVETSRYVRYERFAEEIDWVLAAVGGACAFPAVTRVGMRYINEIALDGVDELADWRGWIREDLLAGGLIDGYRARDYLATALFELDEHRRMTLRYGRVSQPVADPNGVLRIDESPSGPYFLLDIDGFWEPSTDQFREYDAQEVQAVSLALHQPIRDIFELAITPALRARLQSRDAG